VKTHYDILNLLVEQYVKNGDVWAHNDINETAIAIAQDRSHQDNGDCLKALVKSFRANKLEEKFADIRKERPEPQVVEDDSEKSETRGQCATGCAIS